MTNSKRKILSLFLATLISISGFGWNIDFHYCQGALKSISLFGTAQSCHDISRAPSCHLKATKVISEEIPSSCSTEGDKNCCQNERKADFLDYDSTLSQQLASDLRTFDHIFSFEIGTRHLERLAVVDTDVSIAPNPPPLLEVPLRIKYQSFLC